LNEGFATFCEFAITDVLYPEFEIWNEFAEEQQADALSLDALCSSHPIDVVCPSRNVLLPPPFSHPNFFVALMQLFFAQLCVFVCAYASLS
jgi:hypothetical protein